MPRLLLLLIVTLAAGALLVEPMPSRTAQAVFPGANGKIAFTSNRDGNLEIYVMESDGNSQTNLTNGVFWDGGPAGPPSWSPDGSQIAFASNRDGDFEVYIMNDDGSDVHALTDNSAVDGTPSWSSDGSQIVFSSDRDGNPEIYAMDANGENQRRLTDDPGWDLFPAWWPNRDAVAFQSSRDDLDPAGCIPDCELEIYLLSFDGRYLANITGHDGADVLLDWSPDGLSYAFQSDRSGGSDIFIYSLLAVGTINLSAGQSIDTQPAWSPDGTLIAFSTDEGSAAFDVYRMLADGTSRTRLTTSSGDDMFPDWQPRNAGDVNCAAGVNSIAMLSSCFSAMPACSIRSLVKNTPT